jgi:hypothetical protein
MGEPSEPIRKPAARRALLAMAAAVLLALGIFGIGFGTFWAPGVLEVFEGNAVAQNFETVIPFVPIFLIALAAYLAIESRLQR